MKKEIKNRPCYECTFNCHEKYCGFNGKYGKHREHLTMVFIDIVDKKKLFQCIICKSIKIKNR